MRLNGVKIRAVINDVDGVMINFWDSALPILTEVACRHSLPMESIYSYLAYVNDGSGRFQPTLRGALKTIWPNREVRYDSLEQSFRQIEVSRGFVPCEGAKAALIWMKSRGLKLAVCTTNGNSALKERMRYLDLSLNFFDALNTADSRLPKPHKKSLASLLKKLDCSPAESVYVGDWETDYLLAKNAGVPFVAVTSGAFQASDFLAMGVPPEYIVPSLAHLADLFTP